MLTVPTIVFVMLSFASVPWFKNNKEEARFWQVKFLLKKLNKYLSIRYFRFSPTAGHRSPVPSDGVAVFLTAPLDTGSPDLDLGVLLHLSIQ